MDVRVRMLIIGVSACCNICVLMLVYIYTGDGSGCERRQFVMSACVCILLYTCRHTAIYGCPHTVQEAGRVMGRQFYVCVCLHTGMYVCPHTIICIQEASRGLGWQSYVCMHSCLRFS